MPDYRQIKQRVERAEQDLASARAELDVLDEFRGKLGSFKQAAHALERAWQNVDPFILGASYPEHWHSFEEELAHIDAMCVTRWQHGDHVLYDAGDSEGTVMGAESDGFGVEPAVVWIAPDASDRVAWDEIPAGGVRTIRGVKCLSVADEPGSIEMLKGVETAQPLAERVGRDRPPEVKLGERYELTCDVERYPHFTARQGMRGTITDVQPDVISLRMDEYLGRGADEWSNEIVFSVEDHRDLFPSAAGALLDSARKLSDEEIAAEPTSETVTVVLDVRPGYSERIDAIIADRLSDIVEGVQATYPGDMVME